MGAAPPNTPTIQTEGQTQRLCNWVYDVKLSDIPSDVQERAKYLILDGLTCLLVGAKLPWSEKAADAVFDMDPPGTATVFGYDRVCGIFRTLPFQLFFFVANM